MSRRISSIVKSAKAQDRNSGKKTTRSRSTGNVNASHKPGDKNRENNRRESAPRRSGNRSPKSSKETKENDKAQKGRSTRHRSRGVTYSTSSTDAHEPTSRRSNERHGVLSLRIDGNIESITPVELEELLVLRVTNDQQLLLITRPYRKDGHLESIWRISTDEIIRICIRFLTNLLWWTVMLVTGLLIAYLR